MITTKLILRTTTVLSKNLAIVVLLIACMFSQTYAETVNGNRQETATESKLQTTVANLESIQKSVEQKQNQLREQKDILIKTQDASEKQEIEQKLLRIKTISAVYRPLLNILLSVASTDRY